MITNTADLARDSGNTVVTPALTWGPHTARPPEIRTRHIEAGTSFSRVLCGTNGLHQAENADVRGGLLVWPDLTIPFTLSDGSTPTPASYVFSPISHYVRYPTEELHRTHGKVARMLPRAGLSLLQSLLATSGAERVIQINSWLVSTNLHPRQLWARLEQAVELCIRAFPDHLILLRNVHAFGESEGINAVRRAGFVSVASRKIYMFDGRKADFASKTPFKRDRTLWKDQTRFKWVTHEDIDPEESARILELYRSLYIHKHSTLNLRYTEDFVRSAVENRWLDFRGLRDEHGKLVGVLGIFELENTATTPFVGYDTSLPEEAGLYRRLVSGLHQEVLARGWILNFSSGAGEFKRRRGGEAVIEHSAFYWSHLPAYRKAACSAWGGLLNSVGTSILKRSSH